MTFDIGCWSADAGFPWSLSVQSIFVWSMGRSPAVLRSGRRTCRVLPSR